MLEIAGGGLALLVGLAVAVGLASDRSARESAWRRIAVARRINQEDARRLEERERELDAALSRRERNLERRERLLAERERAVAEAERRRQDPRAG